MDSFMRESFFQNDIECCTAIADHFSRLDVGAMKSRLRSDSVHVPMHAANARRRSYNLIPVPMRGPWNAAIAALDPCPIPDARSSTVQSGAKGMAILS
jgi:hypothetical protein